MSEGEQSVPKFGFVGVGAIGRPIAERIAALYPVIICDANEAAVRSFSGHAGSARSGAEIGDMADIVFACLPSPEAHRRVILDPVSGIVAGKRLRGFVQIGTTGPELARTLHSALNDRGLAMIDAPVTGGVPRARAGTLTVIASGDEALYAECAPALRTFASEIVYAGSVPGSAQTMKLINNVLSATNLAIACEALVLGAKAGLDPSIVLKVLNSGTGQNSATLTKIPDHIIPRSFDYGGRLELVCKDLAAFLAEAEHLHVSSPLTALVERTYRIAVAHGSKDEDMTTVIRHMEEAAGVTVGRKA